MGICCFVFLAVWCQIAYSLWNNTNWHHFMRVGLSVRVIQLAQFTFLIVLKWNDNVSLSLGFVVLWGPGRVDGFSRCSRLENKSQGASLEDQQWHQILPLSKAATEASEFSFKLLRLKRSFIFTLIYQPVLNCKSGTYEQRMSLLSAVTLTSDWRDTELYFLKVHRGIG